MGIFLFVLGLIIGFGAKLGIDQYQYFIERQKKTQDEMEEVLTRFKAIELIKDEQRGN